MKKRIHVLHIKEISHFNKDGKLLWSGKNLDNILHDEGEQYILSAAFATGYSGFGVAPDNLYLGLDTSTRTLAETDTLSLVPKPYNNLTSALVVLKAMKKYGCRNFVFSSSATVYGDAKVVPITEDFPLSTTNPYGSTKLMIEDMLRDFGKLYQFHKEEK